jgi:hypothetical protein
MLQCRQNTTWHFHGDAVHSFHQESGDRLQVDVPLGYPKHWHSICLNLHDITLGRVMRASQRRSRRLDNGLGGSGIAQETRVIDAGAGNGSH